MNPGTIKLLKAVAAVVVLGVLFFTVLGYWRDFRSAARTESPGSQPATEAPPATSEEGSGEGQSAEKPAEQSPADTPAAKPDVVIVLIDGLNFRTKPAGDAEVLRGLDKGEQLTLVKTQSGWYQVKDSDGKTGWISSNPDYSRVEKR